FRKKWNKWALSR
nr:Chain L, peptide from Pro-adrenomedullin [Homo sapiens]